MRVKVLQCHNLYQLPGGEDRVVEDEAALLTEHGHEVVQYTRHNDEVDQTGKLSLALGTIWSRQTQRHLRDLVRREKPDIAHFHNTLPLMSPSAYYAVRAEGVPVVQTLHNYRLACPKATFLRDDQVCEACLHKRIKWPAVMHACYRDNRSATAALSAMLTVHGSVLGTYRKQVDAYIACSSFSAEKMIVSGLPADRVHIKPNFVNHDPGPGTGTGGYALFLGRLSPEKGIKVLLDTWNILGNDIPLRIVGKGPLEDDVARYTRGKSHIQHQAYVDNEELERILREAACMVLPSMSYEGFPKVIVEAYSHGLPVIATDVGAMTCTVVEGVTGRRFAYGDAADMARVLREVFANPQTLATYRHHARQTFEQEYTADINYQRLMEIYEIARQTFSGETGKAAASQVKVGVA